MSALEQTLVGQLVQYYQTVQLELDPECYPPVNPDETGECNPDEFVTASAADSHASHHRVVSQVLDAKAKSLESAIEKLYGEFHNLCDLSDFHAQKAKALEAKAKLIRHQEAADLFSGGSNQSDPEDHEPIIVDLPTLDDFNDWDESELTNLLGDEDISPLREHSDLPRIVGITTLGQIRQQIELIDVDDTTSDDTSGSYHSL